MGRCEIVCFSLVLWHCHLLHHRCTFLCSLTHSSDFLVVQHILGTIYCFGVQSRRSRYGFGDDPVILEEKEKSARQESQSISDPLRRYSKNHHLCTTISSTSITRRLNCFKMTPLHTIALLVLPFITSALPLAQNADPEDIPSGGIGYDPDSQGDADAGNAGKDTGAVTLSKGAIVAISVVAAVVIIGGSKSTLRPFSFHDG
jgi:hypothetical protein